MIIATILRDQNSTKVWHQNNTKTTSAKTAKNATKMAPKYQPNGTRVLMHCIFTISQNGTKMAPNFALYLQPSSSITTQSHAFWYLERFLVQKLHQDHINNYYQGDKIALAHQGDQIYLRYSSSSIRKQGTLCPLLFSSSSLQYCSIV